MAIECKRLSLRPFEATVLVQLPSRLPAIVLQLWDPAEHPSFTLIAPFAPLEECACDQSSQAGMSCGGCTQSKLYCKAPLK